MHTVDDTLVTRTWAQFLLSAMVWRSPTLWALQAAAYDDVGGDVAEAARGTGLRTLASSHVVLLVLDAAEAKKTRVVRESVCCILCARNCVHAVVILQRRAHMSTEQRTCCS